MPPQPSGRSVPQVARNEAQVAGWHPQRFAIRAPHVCGAEQLPHESSPPHPSGADPQVAPTSEQRRGTHGRIPASMMTTSASASRPPSKPASAPASTPASRGGGGLGKTQVDDWQTSTGAQSESVRQVTTAEPHPAVKKRTRTNQVLRNMTAPGKRRTALGPEARGVPSRFPCEFASSAATRLR